MFDYAGCIHFHSSYSYDAYTPLEQIITSGFKAQLDYLILTDHFSLDARDAGWERYHESGSRKLLLLVGEEISPRYNHYLALQIQKPIVVSKIDLKAQDVIDAVTAQGGFGFIAHPDHAGAPFAGVRAYPWVDWGVRGYAGLSIWDLMGDWISALVSPWGVLRAWFFPARVLKGPRPQALSRWDELMQKEHCIAIGEVDNHAARKRFLGVTRRIFPFDFAFRTIRTHVVLDTPLTYSLENDQSAILDAVRQGRSYISLDLWNDPRGFTFHIFNDSGRATMGGEIPHQRATLVDVKIPGTGRLRLIRNGRVVWEERTRSHFERDVDLPGVYRVEVDQRVCGRWKPWIFSNPIWVRKGVAG